ncbi:phosphonate transport system permease protein [Paucibacter oligotrophus]|uniref:Phosphonate transport system permease protein n=1 Tax=Roseateles oligotrophus TaxID=1769250 RepID=A0A840L1K7_9BURK|nr:ABC transporter permease subunit [Roseateles oligotrophus]MBB4841711.1 phosphonate transport system permease protein [Roseateles oligotrophus]
MSLPTSSPQLRDPAWHGRVLGLSLALLLLWPLLRFSEFRPWLLLAPENLRVTGRFVADFFPPAHSPEFLALLAREAWRTVAMATVGLVLGLLLALPMALGVTRVLSISALASAQGQMAPVPRALRGLLRAVLVILRSVPELVWALIFVRVVGLGPTAGVLAIALSYAGMLGKVYAEVLESGDVAPAQALLRQGAGRLQTFFYALLPQNAAELSSYTVYRWECAIRSSVVLGMVGAGGLGQQLDSAMKMFNGAEVSAILIVFVLLVALADGLGVLLRRSLG